MVASLLFPPTSSRTIRPVHDAWAAALHMVGEVLWHLVKLAVAAATEEGYPQMLPRMTISGGRILIHYATIQAERYLLSAGSHHNRQTPGPSTQPRGAGESHTLIHIETTCQEV